MDIIVGKFFDNHTKRYLLPCVKSYGEDFVNKVESVFKVAVGIGDKILSDSGLSYNNHLFILIDTKKSVKHWKSFLDYIKEQPMYEDDYPFDNIKTGHLHMVVIKLPQDYFKSLEKFKHSQYSKMYSHEQINSLFTANNQVRKVLLKDYNYKVEYTEKLNKLYETNINPKDLEGELDFPLDKRKEIFN